MENFVSIEDYYNKNNNKKTESLSLHFVNKVNAKGKGDIFSKHKTSQKHLENGNFALVYPHT